MNGNFDTCCNRQRIFYSLGAVTTLMKMVLQLKLGTLRRSLESALGVNDMTLKKGNGQKCGDMML